jgi:dihydrofolate reductase
MRIVVVSNVSLDGVTQGYGLPEEDTRGGFAHGGWGRPYGDEVMAAEMGVGDGGGDHAVLFGRRTYEVMAGCWPKQTDGNPFTAYFDATQKYVVSATLGDELPWKNSTRLAGLDDVRRLKEQPGGALTVLGSSVLVQSLLAARLVDEFLISIHPLVLGGGRRLFADDGVPAELELVRCVPTTTGVVIASYRLRG